MVSRTPIKHLIILVLSLALFSTVSAQEDDSIYKKRYSLILGGGPSLLGIDYGFQLENQFTVQLGKFFSLSASYGTAQSYAGMDDVKREYSPEPDLSDDDYTRDQSLFYTRLGLEIAPLNTEHHRAYVGIGPSLNFYNYSGANIISTADTTIFIMSNRNVRTFTYSFFGGYDFTFRQHFLIGLSFYYVNYEDDPTYSAMIRAGYRF